MQSNWVGRLRPVKSVESLISSPMYTTTANGSNEGGNHIDHESILEDAESSLSKSSPATPVLTDVDVLFHAAPVPPCETARPLQNPKTHNRSISHDSYFEFGEFRNSNRVYIDETLEEETLSQSSKLSLETSSGGECSPTRKTAKEIKGRSSDGRRHGSTMMSPVTPPPSAASLVVPTSTIMSESVTSTSSDDVVSEQYTTPKSPLLKPKWKDSEVQTSNTKLYDVGVSTQEDMEQCTNNVHTVMISSSATTTSLVSSGGQTATTTTSSCPVTRDSSEQSLLSHSSSGEPMYELDRNSSVDDSSVESTPCEPFAKTNIIYSPLVDDLSSPASSGGDLFRRGLDPFRVSAEPEERENQQLTTNSDVKNASTLYVCPLYEAGVSTVESLSSGMSVGAESQITDVTSVSESVSPRFNQYENVSAINPGSNRQHNMQIFLAEPKKDCAKVISPMAAHIYENHRLYENQPPPVPAIRKSKSEGAVIQAAISQQRQQLPEQTPVVANVNTVNLTSRPGHYENISELEVNQLKCAKDIVEVNGFESSLPHEGNIYEDIDDDEDIDQNTGNKYETVEFEKGVMKSKESSPASTGAPAPASNSDDEYEKVQENSVVIHHHYAEIEEKMDTGCVSPTPQTTAVVTGSEANSVSLQKENPKSRGADISNNLNPTVVRESSKSEESSPSHSHTEDMITYLEVQTPHLHLRNNSLDDQEELSQRSGCGEGVSCANKLEKMNSLTSDSSGTPEQCPIAGDEGEIRHIDSPINSPVVVTENSAPATTVTVGVNNPLYGLQYDDKVGGVTETKDIEMQMSDGEDMSVNESLSISISIDETTSPSNSKQKQEGLPSTQNTSQDSGENLPGREVKLVSRCNSAPLAVGVHEFTVALSERSDGGMLSLPHGAGDETGNLNDTFSARASAARCNSSTYGENSDDRNEVERRFGDKVLLCKRLSEPSLLFSNGSSSINNPQKTDYSDISNNIPVGSGPTSIAGTKGSNCGGGGGANPSAWKIADAKRLANRKQSVRELLSKFESRDSVSSTSPIQSPTSCGALLPPTGLTVNRGETGSGNNANVRENGGRSASNNNLSNNNNSNNNNNGRFQHHRFSTGDILMTQSMSVVENLSSMLPSSGLANNGNHLPSTNTIVRSDTFPELSRDESASKENTIHGTFSVSDSNDENQGMLYIYLK